MFYGIRDKTRIIADQHAAVGRTVDSSIVQHLQRLRTEIKAHIKVRSLKKTSGRLLKKKEISFRMSKLILANWLLASLRNVKYLQDSLVSSQTASPLSKTLLKTFHPKAIRKSHFFFFFYPYTRLKISFF